MCVCELFASVCLFKSFAISALSLHSQRIKNNTQMQLQALIKIIFKNNIFKQEKRNK